MGVQAVCTLITCFIAIAAILVYVGKSLKSLQQIDANQMVLFKRTEAQGKDIVRIDKELERVKTKQEDCGSCP